MKFVIGRYILFVMFFIGFCLAKQRNAIGNNNSINNNKHYEQSTRPAMKIQQFLNYVDSLITAASNKPNVAEQLETLKTTKITKSLIQMCDYCFRAKKVNLTSLFFLF